MPKPKTIQSIADLRNDPDNANLGTERGLRVLDDSLRECGAGRSILADRDGTVLAGNKTLLRAADIGLPVRVVQTNGTELVVVQRTDLALSGDDGQRERARRLAYFDNRASQLGLAFDAEQILADLEAGVNLEGLWRDDELTELLAGLVEPEAVADPGAQLSRANELQEKWQVSVGDVWTCGQHRICCGDCTDAVVVEAVMGEGEKATAVVSDPPWGIGLDTDYTRFTTGFDVKRTTHAPIAGDDKPFDPRPLLGYDAVVLWGANFYAQYLPIGSWLVWDKRFENDTAFLSDAELAWMKSGHGIYIFSLTSQGCVRPERVHHPTQKPVDLVSWCIEKCKAGPVVYDPYLGSGTTLVSCEQLQRQGRGIEIHPPYCSVALERLSGMQLDCRKVAGA